MQKSVKIEGKRNKLILRKIEQKQTFRRILLTIAIAMLLAVILCFAIIVQRCKKDHYGAEY